MIFQPKILWEILVPECSNRGLKYSIDYHHEWDEKVRAIAGGETIFSPAKGHWVNPENQVVFIEKMIPVGVYCNRKNLNKILDLTIQHYDQEAVFAYKVSNEVIIKYRK